MTIEQQAAEVIGRATVPAIPKGDARRAAMNLASTGLLAPEPQIIRTVDELRTLGPDAFVLDSENDSWLVGESFVTDAAGDVEFYRSVFVDCLPAVVVATGAQVRAARKALEGES